MDCILILIFKTNLKLLITVLLFNENNEQCNLIFHIQLFKHWNEKLLKVR